MVHLWCLQKVKYHHTAVMKMRCLTLFCHSTAYLVSSRADIFFLYFKSCSSFDGPPLLLCEMVHLWCLEKVQYRHTFFWWFLYLHKLTAKLCSLVKWCTSDASIQTTNLFLCSGTSTNCSIKTFQISVWWQCEDWKQDKHKMYFFRSARTSCRTFDFFTRPSATIFPEFIDEL